MNIAVPGPGCVADREDRFNPSPKKNSPVCDVLEPFRGLQSCKNFISRASLVGMVTTCTCIYLEVVDELSLRSRTVHIIFSRSHLSGQR